MDRYTLRTYRELFGLKQLLLFLALPAVLFISAFANASPPLSSRIIAGLLAILPVPVIVVGVHYYMKFRFGRMFAQYERVRNELDAMSNEQIKATVRAAIASANCLRAYPSTATSQLPHSAGDFFQEFDRIDFFLAGNPSPYFSICRTLIGEVPLNPDALKVGEMYIVESCIAVHRGTGRVTAHHPPISKGEVARCGEIPTLHYRSLWHFVAGMAAMQRMGEELGHRFLYRSPLLDKRPRWRIDGANQ